MAIMLPTKKSEVDNRWINQKIGMIGPSGIGKSEFWSHGDKTLYLQLEAGLGHLEVMKIEVRSYQELRDAITALIQANQKGKFPYDTIVIDTIDVLIDRVNEEVIGRGKQKFAKIGDSIHTIGDVPNGAGWQWSTDLIRLVFSKLESLPACIVYIGHQDMKERKTPTDKYHTQTISIGGKTGLNLVAWCDHFLNIEASMRNDAIVRRIRTKPTMTVEAKSRGGVVPHNWKWEDDSSINYKKLRGLFT